MSRTMLHPSNGRAPAPRVVLGLALGLTAAVLSACASDRDGITAPTRSLRDGASLAGRATRTVQILDHATGTMRVTDARTWTYAATIAGRRAVTRGASVAPTILPSATGAPSAADRASLPGPATIAVLARDGGPLHISRQVKANGATGTVDVDANAGEPVSRVTVRSAGRTLAVHELHWARADGGWLLEREEVVSLQNGVPAARVTTVYDNDDAELARSVATLPTHARPGSARSVAADALGTLAREASRAADAVASVLLPTAAWAQTADPCATQEQAVTMNALGVFVVALKLSVDCAIENVIGAAFDVVALGTAITSLDMSIDTKNACLNANPTDPHYGT